ncbi:MAG TPA: ChrR family anti-sigma-E factor [Vineibacter sp.]|nr:ChrR family anti-sigma-E factor [Vineibacter sp.]
MARHPVPADLLLRHAGGRLPEALDLLVATHLAMDTRARRVADLLDDIGGQVLAEEAPAAMSEDALQATLARLDSVDATDVPEPPAPSDPNLRALPRPLWRYLAGDPQWRRSLARFDQIDLPMRATGYSASLVRFPAGRASLRHDHDGTEYTLVLAGRFADSFGAFAPGDVAIRRRGESHRPVADTEAGCICLAVTDAAITLTDPLGRLLNPLIRARARRANLTPQ